MMLRALAFTAVFFVLLVQPALSMTVVQDQRDFSVAVERGKSLYVPLLIESPEIGKVITAVGDLAGWVRFGSDRQENYAITASISALPMIITVPDSAAIGEYDVEINANGTVLSNIKISVVISVSEFITLQTQADVNAKIKELEAAVDSKIGVIQGNVDNLKAELASAITGVIDYQKNVNSLEEANANLQKQVEDLQLSALAAEQQTKEKDVLTGNLAAGTSSIALVIGALIGGAAVFVYNKKKRRF